MTRLQVSSRPSQRLDSVGVSEYTGDRQTYPWIKCTDRQPTYNRSRYPTDLVYGKQEVVCQRPLVPSFTFVRYEEFQIIVFNV